mgnify:CR=1 FL=1
MSIKERIVIALDAGRFIAIKKKRKEHFANIKNVQMYITGFGEMEEAYRSSQWLKNHLIYINENGGNEK